MRLKGQTAIVTGAARGIGRAVAERLMSEGAAVAIADLDPAAARQTADALGPRALAVGVNVADRASVEALVAAVESKLGPVDLLVNNAGVSEIVPFLELDEATWDRHLQVNLKGTFLCCQTVLKGMVERRRGKIINLSSQSGKQGASQYQAYCASKFGVIGLTQSLALEFAPYGITVNAICPGFVFTPLWNKMLPQYAAKRNLPVDKVKDYVSSRIPLGRLCTPEDVAGVAAFLASADADYLTGQAINVTGGALMH